MSNSNIENKVGSIKSELQSLRIDAKHHAIALLAVLLAKPQEVTPGHMEKARALLGEVRVMYPGG